MEAGLNPGQSFLGISPPDASFGLSPTTLLLHLYINVVGLSQEKKMTRGYLGSSESEAFAPFSSLPITFSVRTGGSSRHSSKSRGLHRICDS